MGEGAKKIGKSIGAGAKKLGEGAKKLGKSIGAGAKSAWNYLTGGKKRLA